MLAEKPAFEKLLRDQLERLVEEFADSCPREQVERMAHLAIADFADARVKDYVPLFVYRDVKSRLREGGPSAN